MARYYAQRCDGIQDLRRSAPYLLEPLLTHALREMDDSCRTRLRENWEAGRKDQIISPAIRLCALLLSVLNNSLILESILGGGRLSPLLMPLRFRRL